MTFKALTSYSAITLALLIGPPAKGVDLPPAADSHINSTEPDRNFGNLGNMAVGNGSAALIRFNLSDLPAGTTADNIAKATLRVWVSRIGTAGAIGVAGVNSAWDEASVTFSSSPLLGGTESTALVATANTFATMDLTSLVKTWIVTPFANNGVAVSAATAAPSTVVFLDSKENSATSHAAALEIVLKGPAGATGPQGLQGPAGPRGLQGLPGPTGAAGPRGVQGIQGPQGPGGVSGFIVISQIVTARVDLINAQEFPVACPAGKVALSGSIIRQSTAVSGDDLIEAPLTAGRTTTWLFGVLNRDLFTKRFQLFVTCIDAN